MGLCLPTIQLLVPAPMSLHLFPCPWFPSLIICNLCFWPNACLWPGYCLPDLPLSNLFACWLSSCCFVVACFLDYGSFKHLFIQPLYWSLQLGPPPVFLLHTCSIFIVLHCILYATFYYFIAIENSTVMLTWLLISSCFNHFLYDMSPGLPCGAKV